MSGFSRFFLLSLFLLIYALPARACSFVKLSKAGKTVVGNNEDMWSRKAKIWFEQGKTGEFGAMYVGHERESAQGGMNTAGLVFDGLTLPLVNRTRHEGKQVEDREWFVRNILHTCANIEEVAEEMEKVNRGWITAGMLCFADRAGDVLIVEADTLIFVRDSMFALVNVRPSKGLPPDSIPVGRYQKARKMFGESPQATKAWCGMLMDTMAQCRPPLGDGTLYTTVYDLQSLTVDLYFYHDFDQVVTLDLRENLKKGNHTLEMAPLFEPVQEYEDFLAYWTPFNNSLVFVGLWIWLGLCILSLPVLLVRIGWLGFAKKEVKRMFGEGAFLLVPMVSVPLGMLLQWKQSLFYFGWEGLPGHGPTQLFSWAAFLVPLLSFLCLIVSWRFRKELAVKLIGFPLAIGGLLFSLMLGYWGLL